MAFVLAERPAAQAARPMYKVGGPLAKEAELCVSCGWKNLMPRWDDLQKNDRRELDTAGFNTKYILGGESSANKWVPPSQRKPAPDFVLPQAENSAAMKQSHLHGNVGIITNPQPALTDNASFLVHVPAWKPQTASSLRPSAPRDIKVWEQSSEIFDSSRRLEASTRSPREAREDLFDANYPSFPYGDSSLDGHVPKRQIAFSQFEAAMQPSPAPIRSPRVRFEPPARPGAAFRRRKEKNYSDLFDHSPPPAVGKSRLPSVDANQLSHHHCSFLDIRTEVARRNGETRGPVRQSSAPPSPCESRDGRTSPGLRLGDLADKDPMSQSTKELPGSAAQSWRRVHSPRGDGTGVWPAGGGGCGGGGEAEFVAAAAEEESAIIAAEEQAARLWRERQAGGSLNNTEIEPSPASISGPRRDFVKDMCRRVFGERQMIDWNAVQSPRSEIPGMKSPRPPRSPKSPPALVRPTSLAGFNEDNLENFACKAAARGRFQRQMSSDPKLLFGTSD